MNKQPREIVIERINKSLAEGKPIIVAGAGVGLVAKCAEIGGADLIVSYDTGRWRYRGLPQNSLMTRNANQESWEIALEALAAVKETPIVLGVNATDPLLWFNPKNMERWLKRTIEYGFLGVENWPTISLFPWKCSKCGEPYYARQRWEDDNCGFSQEVKMLKLARKMGLYTLGYAYSLKEAEEMAEAGVDCITVHCGWTTGGLRGSKHPVSLDEAAKKVQTFGVAIKKIKPDCVIIAHGGPIYTPEHTRYIYEHAPIAQGFEACSALERIPVEKILIETAKAFKSIPLPERNR